MRSGAARATNGAAALHVIAPNPLAELGLRSILTSLPDVTFHSKIPACLPPTASQVVVIDAGALTAPIAELRRVTRCSQKAPVNVVGAPCSRARLIELLSLGVAGFVPCNRVRDELQDAIRSVRLGRMWMPAGTTEEFDRQRRLLANRQQKGAFTGRETAILGMLERALCNKEIASILGPSVSTVKFHLGNIFIKTGVPDRVAAVEWAKRAAMAKPLSENRKPD